MIRLSRTVKDMNIVLMRHALKKKVKLNEIKESFINRRIDDLDMLFNDGGHAKQVIYIDPASVYAAQFGEPGSEQYEKAKQEALGLAMELFNDAAYTEKIAVTKMDVLLQQFKATLESNNTFFAVALKINGATAPEVVINHRNNLNDKRDYYLATYNNNLFHKRADVQIIGYADGSNFSEVEERLKKVLYKPA